jgi:hypothetical protein
MSTHEPRIRFPMDLTLGEAQALAQTLRLVEGKTKEAIINNTGPHITSDGIDAIKLLMAAAGICAVLELHGIYGGKN